MIRSGVVAFLAGALVWGCGSPDDGKPKGLDANPPLTGRPSPVAPPPGVPAPPPAFDGLSAPLPALPQLQDLPCLTPDGSEQYAGLPEPAGGWRGASCDDVAKWAPPFPPDFGFTEEFACVEDVRPKLATACEEERRWSALPGVVDHVIRSGDIEEHRRTRNGQVEETVRFRLDAAGHTVWTQTERGGRVFVQRSRYDDAGRLTETEHESDGQPSQIERYGYDDAGRTVWTEIRRSYDISVTERKFADDGRVAWKRSVRASASGVESCVEQTQYFCDGRPARTVSDCDIGYMGPFRYDAKGRLTEEPGYGGSLQYGYDANGTVRMISGGGYFWSRTEWYDATGFKNRWKHFAFDGGEYCRAAAAPDVLWWSTGASDGYSLAPTRADGLRPLSWRAELLGPNGPEGADAQGRLRLASARQTYTCDGELVSVEWWDELRDPRTGTSEQSRSELRRVVQPDGSILERHTLDDGTMWSEAIYRFNCADE